MNQPKLVEIVWIDHASTSGWVYPDHFDAENALGTMRSVGWVVHENKQSITISTTYSENKAMCDPLTLDKRCIERIDELEID